MKWTFNNFIFSHILFKQLFVINYIIMKIEYVSILREIYSLLTILTYLSKLARFFFFLHFWRLKI